MPSLLSAAAAVAIMNGNGTLERAAPSIGSLRYSQLSYEIRASYEGAGLGGQTPYCAQPNEDLVMVVYTVKNSGDADISAPAAPRLSLISPEGLDHRPDPRYTQALASKVAPPLTVRRGVIPAGGSVLLADVFTTPRAPGGTVARLASIIYGGWRIRPGRPGTLSINLPNPENAEVLECPREPSLTALRPNESR